MVRSSRDVVLLEGVLKQLRREIPCTVRAVKVCLWTLGISEFVSAEIADAPDGQRRLGLEGSETRRGCGSGFAQWAASREKRPRADAKVRAFRVAPAAHSARGLAGRAVEFLQEEGGSRARMLACQVYPQGSDGELDESPRLKPLTFRGGFPGPARLPPFRGRRVSSPSRCRCLGRWVAQGADGWAARA
jgi:hypothetical protein